MYMLNPHNHAKWLAKKKKKKSEACKGQHKYRKAASNKLKVYLETASGTN